MLAILPATPSIFGILGKPESSCLSNPLSTDDWPRWVGCAHRLCPAHPARQAGASCHLALTDRIFLRCHAHLCHPLPRGTSSSCGVWGARRLGLVGHKRTDRGSTARGWYFSMYEATWWYVWIVFSALITRSTGMTRSTGKVILGGPSPLINSGCIM
jgi:hypothetical protein